MAYTTESDVEPFAISDPGGEADALAAEILTTTYPAHAKAIEGYWHFQCYEYRAPTATDDEIRYVIGAELRAIFERQVLRRILTGNPPFAPSVRVRTSPARELMYPPRSTTRPLFRNAIEVVQAPGRVMTSSNDEWARGALARAAAAAESLAAMTDDSEGADELQERVRRVRAMAVGDDEALAILAHTAVMIQER